HHEGTAAAGVLRAGHPDPEGVAAGRQHWAGVHQLVAVAAGGEEVDRRLRSAVDRDGADAVSRVLHAVEGDPGTGEGDAGRVTGGVAPAVRAVEQVAAATAAVRPGTAVGEPGIVHCGHVRRRLRGAGRDVHPARCCNPAPWKVKLAWSTVVMFGPPGPPAGLTAKLSNIALRHLLTSSPT